MSMDIWRYMIYENVHIVLCTWLEKDMVGGFHGDFVAVSL